jgi:DNA-binding CsgD family transcriptional regulator
MKSRGEGHRVSRNVNENARSLLTEREHEVLVLYLRYLNAKKVARELGTKHQTVQNQLSSIEHKLGADSREHLVALTLSTGFAEKLG